MSPMLSPSSRRRILRNLALCLGGSALMALVFQLQPGSDVRHKASMGTAYVSLLYLALSLILGPWNVLRRRPNPVSFDLRRDISIWSGIFALVHTGVGLTVHLRGHMWMYFLKRLHPVRPQTTAFGAANYTGLIAALLFLLLLAISNDLSLRSLGTRRWKSIQRWAYAAFALTVAHGALYQLIEKRQTPWVAIFAALSAAALTLQLTGWRRRSARPTSSESNSALQP